MLPRILQLRGQVGRWWAPLWPKRQQEAPCCHTTKEPSPNLPGRQLLAEVWVEGLGYWSAENALEFSHGLTPAVLTGKMGVSESASTARHGDRMVRTARARPHGR